MEEFLIAYSKVQAGRKNFIIIVLVEKLRMKELTKEMKTYIQKHKFSVIDATSSTKNLVKRLRSVNPLKELKLDISVQNSLVDNPFSSFPWN